MEGDFLVGVEMDHLMLPQEIPGGFWSKVPPGGLVKCVFERAIMHSSSEGLPSDHQFHKPSIRGRPNGAETTVINVIVIKTT